MSIVDPTKSSGGEVFSHHSWRTCRFWEEDSLTDAAGKLSQLESKCEVQDSMCFTHMKFTDEWCWETRGSDGSEDVPPQLLASLDHLTEVC